MAMFRRSQFEDLEGKFSDDQRFKEGVHSFTLTLIKKTPIPNQIIDYAWKVTLEDGYEFEVPMGAQNISFPATRLEVIIEKLKKAKKYQNDYLANAINEKIDEIYREHQ